MILQNFIDEQKRLLDLERTEEVNQSKIISESSPKVLEEKNLCIRKLRIVNIFTGLYGRTIIEFQSKQKSEENSKRIFSQGDIIGICNDSSKNDISKSIANGLYYKSTKDTIQIALDNDPEDNADLKDSDAALFRLVKLSSEITYQRLKAGLKYLEKRTNPLCGDYLIDLLLGDGSLCYSDALKPITYINKNLNDSQREAVSFALSRPDLAIVHGPPGTGKTTVAVEIIAQLILKHGSAKVLVCTPSNIALDNLAEKLVQVRLPANKKNHNIELLRLGHSARVMTHLSGISLDHKLAESDQAELIKEVRSQIDGTVRQSLGKRGGGGNRKWGELRDLRRELREREMKAVREVLARSQVVLSTLTGLRSNKSLPLNDIEFDVVLIDEASQAIEAACWLAVPRGKKLILAGDHKQLPPTVLSDEAVKAGLGRSLMERLLELFPQSETTRMLTCQYRMHIDIMRWSSDTFYNSLLTAHASVAGHILSDICIDFDSSCGPLAPLVFIDTAGCDLWELSSAEEDSRGNLGEAHLAAVVIRDLVARFGLRPDQIGVITPYSRQVPLVRQCLRDKVDLGTAFDLGLLEVSTVDGFQGREKEVIVTTLVRSNPSGNVGFLAETRRLNVALTRAKRHLCVIGDSSTVRRSRDAPLCSLIDYWEKCAEVRSARDQIYEEDVSAGDCVKAAGTTREPKETDGGRLERKLCQRVRKFAGEASAYTLELPTDLSPRLRAVLHELSEQLHLTHISVGTGTSRRLIISKPKKQIEVKVDIEIDNDVPDARGTDECHQEETLEVEVTVPEVHPKEEEVEVTEGAKCEEEDVTKERTSSDILREKTQHLEQILKEKPMKSKREIAPKTKKKKPAKTEAIGSISEDEDAVLERFQQMNKVCQHPQKCATQVAVLGFDCRFCRWRFCATHAQPEVHGCCQATLNAWRAGEEAPRPLSRAQEVRRTQLGFAMARKIGGMREERTGRGSTK